MLSKSSPKVPVLGKPFISQNMQPKMNVTHDQYMIYTLEPNPLDGLHDMSFLTNSSTLFIFSLLSPLRSLH